jgi:drug/metabolite transporter (DMT)-like permease
VEQLCAPNAQARFIEQASGLNMRPQSQHRLGLVLVTAAAVAWSTAPFFTRLLPFDAWTILFWRGVFGGGSIVAFLLLTEGRGGLLQLVSIGTSGWVVACLSTLGMVCFIPALQLTSVANVAVINAILPLVAAGLAWIWLRELAHLRTLLASLVALCGVVIIVGGLQSGSDILGIGLACSMVLAMAAMTVTIRRYKHTPMVAAAGLSNFMGSLVSAPFAHGLASLSATDIVLFAGFGVLQVGMGLTLFVLGSRQLPSAQASLIATLESPLMPFWVWLAFKEVPTNNALVGGALVMGAVITDIAGDLHKKQPAAIP